MCGQKFPRLGAQPPSKFCDNHVMVCHSFIDCLEPAALSIHPNMFYYQVIITSMNKRVYQQIFFKNAMNTMACMCETLLQTMANLYGNL